MADGDTPAPAGAPAQADAKGEQRPQLGIQSQYIKDLSFENPAAPESLVQTGSPPEIQVNVQVEARPIRDNIFEVSLHIVANAKQGETEVFLLDLTYNGVFSVIGVPDEAVQLVLLVECPRLLFPFARRVIADATRDGGFPPLMLSPIDFLTLFRERQAAQQASTSSA